MKEPIAFLGGTFDPIHIGHLRIAEEVAEALQLAHVRLVPSGCPPHRAPPMASSAHRLAMCELAALENPRLAVDPREVRKVTASYTIETLESLRLENAGTPLVMILGADAFLGLHRWHRWTEIFDYCHIAVVARPGFVMDSQLPHELRALFAARYSSQQITSAVRAQSAGRIVPVTVTALDISATHIRALIRDHKSVRYLVPNAVEEYLRRNSFFSNVSPPLN